jgi:Rrf2 family iron-sulfur cluster assembly transcriptional regulator
VRVTDLAADLRIPRNYLSKILHQLSRRGLLISSRGKRGGFRLAGSPSTMRLAAVVGVFDAMEERRQCLLGRATCSDRQPCAVHVRWKRVSDDWLRFFRETSIGELVTREEVAVVAEGRGTEAARGTRRSR